MAIDRIIEDDRNTFPVCGVANDFPKILYPEELALFELGYLQPSLAKKTQRCSTGQYMCSLGGRNGKKIGLHAWRSIGPVMLFAGVKRYERMWKKKARKGYGDGLLGQRFHHSCFRPEYFGDSYKGCRLSWLYEIDKVILDVVSKSSGGVDGE
jgi:hypothetical protein